MTSNSDQTIDPKWGEISPMHDPRILANFKARKTDILITTAPKAGTTWMQQILHQLKTGGDVNFDSIDNVIPWLEIQRKGKHWSEIIAYFDTIKNPRIFKTHCTYQQTPGVDFAKIILSSRDPRDACISFYHHTMNLTENACQMADIKSPKDFDEYFRSWMEFGTWYRNISSWWPHINKQNILWLRYEDMKADLEKSIDQILDFLDWKLDDTGRPKVLEYCSFQWMKANSDKFTHRDENGRLLFTPGSFIRKGSVGDYRSLMSKSQEKQILDRAYKILEPECLKFLGLV